MFDKKVMILFGLICVLSMSCVVDPFDYDSIQGEWISYSVEPTGDLWRFDGTELYIYSIIDDAPVLSSYGRYSVSQNTMHIKIEWMADDGTLTEPINYDLQFELLDAVLLFYTESGVIEFNRL